MIPPRGVVPPDPPPAWQAAALTALCLGLLLAAIILGSAG